MQIKDSNKDNQNNNRIYEHNISWADIKGYKISKAFYLPAKLSSRCSPLGTCVQTEGAMDAEKGIIHS